MPCAKYLRSPRALGYVIAVACFITVLAGGASAQSGPVTYTDTEYENVPKGVLAHPTGLALDVRQSPPIVYVADTRHHVIRAFQSSQLQTTIGAGNAGYKDGSFTAAQFDNPTGLDLEPAESYCTIEYLDTLLYVGDSSNHVLRQVAIGFVPGQHCPVIPTNDVLTVAGNGTVGFVNGPAKSAEFSSVAGLHIPLLPGYMVDSGNNAIRALSTSGTVSTYAGTGATGFVNGNKATAEFNLPTKITADASQNLYVADSGNHVIREISTAGVVTTFAGNGTIGYVNGSASAAEFSFPTSVAFYDGYFYVADSTNNCIRRIDSNGNVSTYAGAQTGGFVNGTLTQARFASPTDLAIYNNFMYVSDTNNNAIRLIDMTAGEVYTYAN